MSVDTHDSPHTIRWSPRHTLGVEQELHTVRRADSQLVGAASLVIEPLTRRSGLADRVVSEYMANTLEVTTPVCTRVSAAMRFLRRVHAAASRVARAQDLALSPIGIHPFADPADQAVTDTPRYHAALEREQLVGVEQQIIGLHIHVGVPSGDAAVAVMDELAVLTPLFVALAASSPFHRGADTGYESFRPMLGDRLPPSGVAPHFESWSDFTEWFDAMKASGYIANLTDIWWDVRPSRYGTVELRVSDGAATFEEMEGLVALAQCAVAAASAPGATRRHLSTDQLRLNRFEAQRYGIDAMVALTTGGPRRSLRDHLEEIVTRFQPTARRLGCEAELLSLREMATRGSSARRQRSVFAATGDLTAVVRAAVADLGGVNISRNAPAQEGLGT